MTLLKRISDGFCRMTRKTLLPIALSVALSTGAVRSQNHPPPDELIIVYDTSSNVGILSSNSSIDVAVVADDKLCRVYVDKRDRGTYECRGVYLGGSFNKGTITSSGRNVEIMGNNNDLEVILSQDNAVNIRGENSVRIKSIEYLELTDGRRIPVVTENGKMRGIFLGDAPSTDVIIGQPAPDIPESIRVVYISVAADEEFRESNGSLWTDVAQSYMQQASDNYYNNFGIRLQIVEYIAYESRDDMDYSQLLYHMYRDLYHGNFRPKGELVVWYSGQSDDSAGRGYMPGRLSIIIESHRQECTVNATMHEIGHNFGLSHSNMLIPSVMNGHGGCTAGWDARSKEAMMENKYRDFR